MRGLAELYAHCRAAWPSIALSGGESTFSQHVQRNLPAGADPSALCVEDLYLAYACAEGSAEALLVFDRLYLSQIVHFLPASDRDPAFVDELRQALRDKFFVSRNGAAPKIAGYSGRGSLHSWVRTAAVHTARNHERARRSDPLRAPSEAAVQALLSDKDPELIYFKGQYRQEFKDAMQAALASLPSEQRDVIRLHYVDGLNIDRIGVKLGVNRATVARWRTAARQAILLETRRQLRLRLRLSDSEFSSLAQLVRSQLDLSLARFLGAAKEPTKGRR